MKVSWLVLCVGMLLISGCGQKGPLYLPDDTQQKQTTPSQ